MNIAPLAALLAALSLPMAASAQVVQQPPLQAQTQHNTGASQYKHWMKRLAPLNLSSQQQQQAQSMLGQFAQQHPAGSPRDPQGTHALRAQIFAILSPAQQVQLQAEMKAQHEREMQHRAMRQQQMQQQQIQPPQQQMPPQQQGPPQAQPPATR